MMLSEPLDLYNSNRVTVVFYPGGSGGKFLINCLGLSPGSLFQHSDLVRKQVAGEFGPATKFNTLMDRLSSLHTYWNDLGLGCGQLLGMHDANITPAEVEQNVKMIVKTNHRFYFASHDRAPTPDQTPPKMLDTWKNANVIILYNYASFLEWRSGYEGRGPGPGKPADTHGYVYWDTSRYFSVDDTLSGIKELYDHYELPDFNEGYISAYYLLWRSKLKEIRQRRALIRKYHQQSGINTI